MNEQSRHFKGVRAVVAVGTGWLRNLPATRHGRRIATRQRWVVSKEISLPIFNRNDVLILLAGRRHHPSVSKCRVGWTWRTKNSITNKKNIIMNAKTIIIITCALFLAQCNSSGKQGEQEDGHSHEKGQHEGHSEKESGKDAGGHQHEKGAHLEKVHLSPGKLKTFELAYDTLRTMNLSESIKTNGRVRLAPDDHSMISALIGGRVKKVNVMEGDYVQQGETLALLEGPAVAELQQNYLVNKAELPYLKKEYERKKKLLDEKVGAAGAYQKAKAEYQSTLARLRAQEQKLKMVHIFSSVKDSNVAPSVPVMAPFSGHIGDVKITRGQFVEPKQPLVEVMNTDKAHIDLDIYEKDLHRIKKGQTVMLRYANRPGEWITGKIFKVGKKFQKDNQSVRVHAQVDEKAAKALTPGVYVTARIWAETGQSFALPEEAVIRDGNKTFVFAPVTELVKAMQHLEEAPGDKKKFVRIPVETGTTDGGFTSIRKFKKEVPTNIRFVTKSAGILQAEMKKSAGGHQH